MGNEVVTRVELDGKSAEAKALLETEEVIVRGPIKLRLPFKEMQQVETREGVLRIRWAEHELRIELGKSAGTWAEKIRNPKSVIDKLGVKAAQKVSVVGKVDDGDGFLQKLEARSGNVTRRLRKESDIIFYAAADRNDLRKLASLRESIVPNGAIWVIRPRGTSEITDADVIAAAKVAGLVDVKVVRFSDTHTAEKLVIPVTKR